MHTFQPSLSESVGNYSTSCMKCFSLLNIILTLRIQKPCREAHSMKSCWALKRVKHVKLLTRTSAAIRLKLNISLPTQTQTKWKTVGHVLPSRKVIHHLSILSNTTVGRQWRVSVLHTQVVEGVFRKHMQAAENDGLKRAINQASGY